MLLTVVTSLSLAGTPSVPQTWFGATAGAEVPPGPVLTVGPEVTRLTLAGVPGLPPLTQTAGGLLNVPVSDTISVSVTEYALGSSSKTWTFSGSAEGWADEGLLPTVTAAYTGVYGNPSGGFTFDVLSNQGALVQDEAAVVSFAWTDLGVPPARNVVSASLAADVYPQYSIYLNSHNFGFRLRDGADTHITGSLLSVSPPNTPSVWASYSGSVQSVGGSNNSDSVVKLRALYSSTRGTAVGWARTVIDNVSLTAFWEGVAVAPTAAEAITELKLNAVPGAPIWDPSGREISQDQFPNVSDTLAVAIVEEPIDWQEVETYDDLPLSLSEAQQSLLRSTPTDTLRVTLATESAVPLGIGGTPTPYSLSDTLAVALTESASIAVSLSATDSLSVSLSEATPTIGTQELIEKPVTDSLTVDLLEQWQLGMAIGFISLDVTDELVVSLSESSSVLNIGLVRVIELYPYQPEIEVWPVEQ